MPVSYGFLNKMQVSFQQVLNKTKYNKSQYTKKGPPDEINISIHICGHYI